MVGGGRRGTGVRLEAGGEKGRKEERKGGEKGRKEEDEEEGVPMYSS